MIYVDAPGGTAAGGRGYAVLPDHDLDGLVDESESESKSRRWIGGSGHELGHGFGLLHPTEPHPTALMDKGYGIYPACTFTDEDLKILASSPFIDHFPATNRSSWRIWSSVVLISLLVTLISVLIFIR